jgi:hypothetical protein
MRDREAHFQALQFWQPAASCLSDGYGLCGVVLKRPTYTAVGHDGDVAGYEAALYMNRASGIGVIVLANSTGDDALDSDALALDALDILSK